MILQALAGYYDRLSQAGKVPPLGFKKVPIPFVVIIGSDGSFIGIDDTRSGEGKGKQAREFHVPVVFEGSRTSNVQANLLWDKSGYVFGINKKAKSGRLEQQKKAFKDTIDEYILPEVMDEGVAATLEFLENNSTSVVGHPLWDEIVSADANLAFRIEGSRELTCQSKNVREAVEAKLARGGADTGVCLVTGERRVLARLENPIKALRGSRTAESHLVSFNAPSFRSYQKSSGDNSRNAPISKMASFAYSTALNHLRQSPRQSLYVGDATMVFWAERPHNMEEWFSDLFVKPAKEESEQDNEAIRALYKAAGTGAPPLEEGNTKFYVLGLSPNASRISVRFWHVATVGELARNIRRHFDDCAMVHGPRERDYLSIFRLLVCTAQQGKAANIQPNLAGEVMKAILDGTPYPTTLLASAVRRIRAEREITYPRASLIKACLARDSRYYKKAGKEAGMALDPANANIGYRLGRLFSVLEKIQEEANPGINATIRDRFYGAASSTPVTAFPHLMKLKNHHLAKLESRGRAVTLERLIGGIMDGVDDFPTHLSLQDQGRFAVGYYHQRQDLFTKKATKEEV